ncbi:trans-sulfuration enzyme family protein [Saccharolobus caldissimus]|uniref:Cystathionine gamma-lyase n=1 Tax=Saccharolobus caldissimus TaxID=1702097 RepID=A0AAQ4CRD5_9CREN|nr:aminotransferase class I/II-fold pyridoxal phosphate-dependent enzyme [Saccharolobus caldissimus]BDB98366.1 hypothetical protein SACC_13830 [Saccharolobus caldissimus]
MKGFNTRAVHEGEIIDSRFGNVVTPIFQTSTFIHPNDDPNAYLDFNSGKPYLYTRSGNPTISALEIKYASLEGAKFGMAFSSGMAAISTTLLSLIKKGDRILAINQLYGQTYRLFLDLIEKYGIEVDFTSVDGLNSLDIENRKYSIIYVESITNPTLQVVDLIELGKYCNEMGIRLIVDATFASPYNQRPLEFGADISIHSGSKYISGHSDVIIGLVATNNEGIRDKIVNGRKMYGGSLDPFAAYLSLRGLKTLGLRMERHNNNAMELAKFLSESEKVRKVYYPGLPDFEYYKVAKKVLKGFGGIVSFDPKGGYECAKKIVKSLKLAIPAPSLGGVETLVTLPRETSHASLTSEELKRMGIPEGLIRVSVGIEDIDDLIEDFKQAISAC